MRDAGSGADLDILALGSRSDKTRLEGTTRVWGRGKVGEKVVLYVWMRSRASSRCCVWSSPTGTCVALSRHKYSDCTGERVGAHL